MERGDTDQMRRLIELFGSMENFSANHQETVVKQWISDNDFNMVAS